ncbi:type I restriction enzyme, S subunit [Alkalimonas amylolytica]|uniref:Type I restriction enzyme, S subunit n=1 Tax=Alkalimonas amylolytica TaxID=152573 RepID=A0A1H3YG13_ALKAM|nr:type I restriction enzyme, S subunit [Alkalimonas amylolytica]
MSGYESGVPSLGGEHLGNNGDFKFDNIKFVPVDFANEMNKGHIQPFDILIVKDGATTAKTSIVRSSFPYKKAVINEHLFRCKVSRHVSAEYIFYFLWSSVGRQEILKDFRGAAQGGISKEFVKKVSIPLAPLEQQKLIVSKIEELFSHIDAGVEGLKQTKAKLQQYRQSVLKDAVTGKLTEKWRELNTDKLEPSDKLLDRILAERRENWEREQLKAFAKKGSLPKDEKWKEKYREPTEPSWAGLTKLPIGWAWMTIEQLAADIPRSIQSGPFGSNLKHSEFTDKGKLVIGIDNVREGFFSKGSDNRISDEKFEELKKYMARPGDVLITVMATVGRTCVVPADIEPAIITKHVYRISIDQKLALPDFVNMYLWGAADAKKQFFGQVIGQTRPGLNGGIIRKVCIPIPSIEEQREIFNAVDSKQVSIDRLEAEISSKLNMVSKLKSSILTKAFAGELVPNDSQQTASELLERIKVEKQQLVKKAKSKPKKEKKVTTGRKSLESVLKAVKEPISPEELMQLAEFSLVEIEEFYIELAALSEQLEKFMPAKEQLKSWPYEKNASLQLKLKD